MSVIFHENFDCRRGTLPGGWIIERNNNLQTPAIRLVDGAIELFSAGNKYIPVIPDVHDCEISFTASVNFTMAKAFGVIVCFRYDVKRRRGSAVRISVPRDSDKLLVEYGNVLANVFTATASHELPRQDELLDKPFEVSISVAGSSLKVGLLGDEIFFAIPDDGSGKVAFSRNHFFDVLKITSFKISTADAMPCTQERSFTVPLAEKATLYPLFCDIALKDLGDCIEARLAFRGGVPDTVPGEGNYHVARVDMISRPFLKVITKDASSEYVVYDEDFVNAVPNLLPDYFYKVLHKKAPWPLERTVRFMKPAEDFELSVGFESFRQSTMRSYAQMPCETLFNLEGRVIYSGKGLAEGQILTRFRSNPVKQLAERLPTTDPRLPQARQFLADNHFFLNGEPAHFTIDLRGKCLPLHYEVTLEDAYLQPIRTLNFTQKRNADSIGVMRLENVTLQVEALELLAPGVYHLRVRSTDATNGNLNEYCAFEVMSTEDGALPPPLISGLPYMYNSRTETRGLLTDGFDVWNGESMDEPHYLSCANFLPPAARKYQVVPTVHAYGREYFCWLGTRCLDHHLAKDNMDLVAQSDYVNCFDELEQRDLTWFYAYSGALLKCFIEFAKNTNDPFYDIPALEKLLAEEKHVDVKTISHAASNHWEEWVDFANRFWIGQADALLANLRKVNPKVRYAFYGPAHIYAGSYKGPEFIRQLLLEHAKPENGFGFMQYEDYPYACDYALERGIYFMTVCLMMTPNARIYPEIYTEGGIQGCPDGSVFYAHPPFGLRLGSFPYRMTRQVYEFALGASYFAAGEFHFWNNCGFQACAFTRPWFEALLRGWRIVRKYQPSKPWLSPGFVSSDGSRRAHENYPGELVHDGIREVRNSSAEEVPYAYEMWRQGGGASGFILQDKELACLTSDDVDFLVLPPLDGMPPEFQEHVRRLHSQGVSLLAFEDVGSLADLFGVKETGEAKTVTYLKAEGDFLPEDAREEYCANPYCKGHYAADGCEVLVNGFVDEADTDNSIPVLTLKRNGNASAAFFNVPPQLIHMEEMPEKFAYGRDSISLLANGAMKHIMRLFTKSEVTATSGLLIAYQAKSGENVVIVENSDQKMKHTIDVRIQKRDGRSQIAWCDCGYELLDAPAGVLAVRFSLEPEECAVLVLK